MGGGGAVRVLLCAKETKELPLRARMQHKTRCGISKLRGKLVEDAVIAATVFSGRDSYLISVFFFFIFKEERWFVRNAAG